MNRTLEGKEETERSLRDEVRETKRALKDKEETERTLRKKLQNGETVGQGPFVKTLRLTLDPRYWRRES